MRERIRNQLLVELSRKNIDIVTDFARDNKKAIDYLVEMVISHEDIVAMRASWVLEKLSESKNYFVELKLPDFLKIVNKIPDSGTRRTIAKVLMQYNIPEEYQGELFDFCLKMIESAKEPVAVKANCMTIIFNLLPQYPELKNEVFAIIEDQIPYNSVGFKSRYNVLKRKLK